MSVVLALINKSIYSFTISVLHEYTLVIIQKPFTSKWKKRDIGMADTMAKKKAQNKRGLSIPIHTCLHCAAY